MVHFAMEKHQFQQHLDAMMASGDFNSLHHELKVVLNAKEGIGNSKAHQSLAQTVRLASNRLLYEVRPNYSCDFSKPLWVKEANDIDDGAHHPVDPIKNLALYARWHKLADAIEWKGLSLWAKLKWPILSSTMTLVMLLLVLSFLQPIASLLTLPWLAYGFAAALAWVLVHFLVLYTKNRMVMDSWISLLDDLPELEVQQWVDEEPLTHSHERESMRKKKK